MYFNTIALVNWGMGVLIMGIFALVCLILSISVIKMVTGNKKDNKD